MLDVVDPRLKRARAAQAVASNPSPIADMAATWNAHRAKHDGIAAGIKKRLSAERSTDVAQMSGQFAGEPVHPVQKALATDRTVSRASAVGLNGVAGIRALQANPDAIGQAEYESGVQRRLNAFGAGKRFGKGDLDGNGGRNFHVGRTFLDENGNVRATNLRLSDLSPEAEESERARIAAAETNRMQRSLARSDISYEGLDREQLEKAFRTNAKEKRQERAVAKRMQRLENRAAAGDPRAAVKLALQREIGEGKPGKKTKVEPMTMSEASEVQRALFGVRADGTPRLLSRLELEEDFTANDLALGIAGGGFTDRLFGEKPRIETDQDLDEAATALETWRSRTGGKEKVSKRAQLFLDALEAAVQSEGDRVREFHDAVDAIHKQSDEKSLEGVEYPSFT